MYRIESLLSARLFLVPQIVGERIYFISNLSGHLSLYAMDFGGSVPEPLLPPDIALQNPHLLQGYSFYVLNDLEKIMVIIDEDGNEEYKPMYIPLHGGYPTPAFEDAFEDDKVFLIDCFPKKHLAYLFASSKIESINRTYRADLKTGKLDKLFESLFGGIPDGWNEDHTKIIIRETYTFGDNTIYLWDEGNKENETLYGVPISNRRQGENVPLNGIHSCHFVPSERGIFMHTTIFEDFGGLGYLSLDHPNEIVPAGIEGEIHRGFGTFNGLSHLIGNRYLAKYNIDGCDWLYDGFFDEESLGFVIENNITGQGLFSDGVVEHVYYDKDGDIFILSFSSATSPNQIYTLEGNDLNKITQHTRERVLAIDEEILSPGEDASYTSFDGTQISARLYLPTKGVNVESPYPLVYYVHGGPQSQERPDFTWFSMPLIQYLTLNGFAVFVPNVRGSTGYGLQFMKEVDRDWGGKDRLDHVYAMTEFLPKDP
ncbi:MAG: prolyl oligopeptidase family serine peptidase, partial [Anaerolineales bacterium]